MRHSNLHVPTDDKGHALHENYNDNKAVIYPAAMSASMHPSSTSCRCDLTCSLGPLARYGLMKKQASSCKRNKAAAKQRLSRLELMRRVSVHVYKGLVPD